MPRNPSSSVSGWKRGSSPGFSRSLPVLGRTGKRQFFRARRPRTSQWQLIRWPILKFQISSLKFQLNPSNKYVLWVAASAATSKHEEKSGFSPWLATKFECPLTNEMTSSQISNLPLTGKSEITISSPVSSGIPAAKYYPQNIPRRWRHTAREIPQVFADRSPTIPRPGGPATPSRAR